MRRKAWLSFLLLFCAAGRAQDVAPPEESRTVPPAYKILRWTEDYSYLSHGTKGGDFFGPIKYIPFRADDPNWCLTLGGELRERFEGVHDPNFGINSSDNFYWLQRLTLLAEGGMGLERRSGAAGWRIWQPIHPGLDSEPRCRLYLERLMEAQAGTQGGHRERQP